MSTLLALLVKMVLWIQDKYECLRGQPPPDFRLSHRQSAEVAEDIL